MKTFKDFVAVIDLQTFIVSLLAVGTTLLCRHYELYADIPTGLIGLAVVFPIVFSINTAYKRREEALRYFSGLKAHAVALYFAHRDWPPSDDEEPGHAERMRQLIEELLAAVRTYLTPEGRSRKQLNAVLGVASRLSSSHEKLRAAGVPGNEISRASQYLSKILAEFERMRNIATYRTPEALRAYSRVFLNVFPIAFGPYFAMLCAKSEKFPLVGYMVAVLYSLVLVTLDNIQEHLEDPFDGVGADDIILDVYAEYSDTVEAPVG